jgi:hypothetical protein
VEETLYERAHWSTLSLTAIAIALLVIVNCGSAVSVWTVLLLRPLMHGVSLFKTNFLLFVICIISVVAFVEPQLCRRKLRILRWTSIIAISLSSAVGLFTFFEVVNRFGLPLSRHMYFFSDGCNSINHFAHLHTTKVGLIVLLRYLGLEQVAVNSDAGQPFAEYINPLLAIVILVSAAVALILLVTAAGSVVRSWHGRYQTIACILYSLAVAHVVKCLIDGGPLAHDFLPSVLVVVFLLLHAEGHDLWYSIQRHWFRILLVLVLFLAVISLFSLRTAFVLQPQQYGFFLSLYFLLASLLLLSRQRLWLLGAMAAPAIIWFGLYYYKNTVPDIVAMNATIGEQHRVYVYSFTEPQNGKFRVLSSDVTASLKGKRVIDAYFNNDQNPLRNRAVAIQSEDISQYNGFLFALRVLKADSIVTLRSTDQIMLRGVAGSHNQNDSTFTFRIAFDPQLFPELWNDLPTLQNENNKFALLYCLDRFFVSQGLRDYVLIPMYYEPTV